MKRPKARDKNTLEINELYFESTSLRVNKFFLESTSQQVNE